MLISWLILGLFLGFMVGSIVMMKSPEILSHMQEIIELYEDYKEATARMREAKNKISDDFGLRCVACLKSITKQEAHETVKKLDELKNNS